MAHRFALLLLVASALAHAADTVYRTTAPDGTVEFTDEPREGAEAVPLRAPTVVPSASLSAGAEAAAGGEVQPYRELRIVAPVQDAVINRHNGPHVAVVESQPPLAREHGHHFLFELDGRVLGTATENRFPLGDLYRGTHTLSVGVVDADGRLLAQSAPVTFHIRQHSRLLP